MKVRARSYAAGESCESRDTDPSGILARHSAERWIRRERVTAREGQTSCRHHAVDPVSVSDTANAMTRPLFMDTIVRLLVGHAVQSRRDCTESKYKETRVREISCGRTWQARRSQRTKPAAVRRRASRDAAGAARNAPP